ncbi:MAG: hypothetical protein J4F30_08635, partial [Acidobacteria bacterium]|nr:hypothetical protein [Acidobacteriota bacterium]
DQRDASRRLAEAADSIRDNKLKEKIRYSKGLIRSRAPETAQAFEDEIGSDIGDLQEKLQAAEQAVGQAAGDSMAEALDRTRDLMRGLESLEHRIAREGEQAAGEPTEGEGQQGQPGQQGGQQPGSQSAQGATDGQPGVGDTVGDPFGGGGWGNRTPGSYFEPGEIRQWQREFQERLGDAQDIRRMLQQEGFSAEELNEIIQRMQEFDDTRVYQSIEVLAGLQTMILEELKRFEYRLRREVDAESEELFLAASDDVPPGFRDLIEEYYRALSREN